MAKSFPKKPIVRLTREQTDAVTADLRRFLDQRFELELGQFEVEEILDFFAEKMAPLYYNKAIFDVQTHLKDRFESIESDLWALEKS